MKPFLLDLNIFLEKNKIQFITPEGTKEDTLSSFVDLDKFCIPSLKNKTVLQKLSETIKNEILEETTKLFNFANDKTSYEKFLFSLLNQDVLKEKILSTLKDHSFVADVFETKLYYEKEFMNIKNQTFFKRFLSKEDYKFTKLEEYDEFNEFINYLNGNYYNCLLFCELNNLKTVNNFISEENGDHIIESFMKELSETFSDCLMIRQSGDEFVILANEEEIEDISIVLEDESFLSAINNSLPLMKTQGGVTVFSTVSFGKSFIEVPSRVFSSQSVIDFKKKFNVAYCKAQCDSYIKKMKIKETHSHDSFESLNNRKEAKELIEYQKHLQEKEAKEEKEQITNEDKIKKLLESPRDVNIFYNGDSK